MFNVEVLEPEQIRHFFVYRTWLKNSIISFEEYDILKKREFEKLSQDWYRSISIFIKGYEYG